MDLELDLDDDLIAAIEHAAERLGLTAQEWARTAIRIDLGLASPEERELLGSRIRTIDPL
jgi:hypothetical protein